MRTVIFAETSTLGIRQQKIERVCLPRRMATINTKYGEVQVKIATLPDGKTRAFPEYEDCKNLARQQNVSLMDVYRAVESGFTK